MLPKQKIRIALADDHGLMQEGLRLILEPRCELVAIAGDGRSLLEMLPSARPDVVLLDITMPLLNGIETAARIAGQPGHPPVIFISMHSDIEYVRAAFEAGASGYVLKRSSGQELTAAIHQVLSGQTYISPGIPWPGPGEAGPTRVRSELTPRQREVLQLVAEGRIAKEIAAALNISVKTVEFHKTSISQILGLRTTAELTRYALEHGIVGAGIRGKMDA